MAQRHAEDGLKMKEISTATTEPLVSVIVPTRNRASLLSRALDSVLRQAFDNIELIVVDDASDDDTSLVIDSYRQRFSKFQYIRNETRHGGAEARNIGISRANGEFIAFLDDDDEWLPGKTSKQLELFARSPDIGAVTCWYYKIGPKGRKKVRLAPEITFDIMLWENFLGSFSLCMVRRTIAKSLTIDPALASGQDWQFWIMLSNITRVAILKEYMVNYHAHAEARISNSKQSLSTLRKHFFKHKESMSKECREYCLINVLRYRILRVQCSLYGKCIRLIKAGLFVKNKAGRFIIKRSIMVFLDNKFNLNIYDPDRETYKFIIQ